MSTVPQLPETMPNRGLQVVEKPPESDRLDNMPWLPCTVSVDLQIVSFTIGDLLKLTKGKVLGTACRQTSDLPLMVNGQLIGWTEFEVVGDHLAVRISDLA